MQVDEGGSAGAGANRPSPYAEALLARRAARLRLADVAARAGTSPATASLALNGKPVSPTTRARVLEAARALRYVPEASARALKTGRTATIGVVVVNRPATDEFTGSSPFFYPILRGALDAGEEQGFHVSWHVITMDLDSEDPQLADLAASGRYDALVVVPQWASDGRYVRSVTDQGVPVVIVNDAASATGGTAPDGRTAAVSLDNDQGIRLAVEHLVAAGHRQIAYLAGPQGHLEADRRLVAFGRTMASHGLDVPASHLQRVEYSIGAGLEGFDILWDRMVAANDGLPTAALAASDYVAAGLMQAAHRRGILVPRDLSVVGFDDLDVACATTPRLTSVAQPLTRIGEIVVASAISLLRGQTVEAVTLPTSLLERQSVADLRPSAQLPNHQRRSPRRRSRTQRGTP